MGPVTRRAEDSDTDAILAFMRQYYNFDEIPFEEIAARDALRRLIRDESLGAVWLIFDGATPVGYIALTFGFSLEYHGRDAFIDEFFIQASHRRDRGVHRFVAM